VTYFLVAKIAFRACHRLNASVGDEEYCDWAEVFTPGMSRQARAISTPDFAATFFMD
jgi:hypothetical protein